MTTRGLNYDDLYHQEEGAEEIAFPPLSFLLWIVFLVLMPILLSNLLVGLAVGDVDTLQKVATEKRTELQIDLVLSIEELLAFINIKCHLPVYRYCKVTQQTIFPNDPKSLLPECCGKNPTRLLVWAAQLYSRWFVSSQFLTSGRRISEAIKSPLTNDERLKKIVTEETAKWNEHSEQNTKQIRDQLKQHSKIMAEQNRKAEDQAREMEEGLTKQNKNMEEQILKELTEHKKKMEEHIVNTIEEQMQQQSKKMEEQIKAMKERMEEQNKRTAESLAGEVASLRETLEKLVEQMAMK